MKINENIWVLMSRNIFGEADSNEEQQLQDLLRAHPSLQQQYDIVRQLLKEKAHSNSDINYELQAKRLLASSEHNSIKPSPKRSIQPLKYWVAAASIIIAVSVFGFYILNNKEKSGNIASNVISTKKGSRTKLELPDGSQVWVNADSKLTYNKNFGNETREVFLEGEAFFDVVKVPSKPFVVQTSSMDIQVLGTAFNVRDYPNEEAAQTALIRGLVEVKVKDNAHNSIKLLPGEKIKLNKDWVVANQNKQQSEDLKSIIELTKINNATADSIAYDVAWTQNRLIFENEKLETIIPVLERWYNVNIHLSQQINTQKRYRGAFENDSLQDVLESLKMAGGFQYQITKDKVLIF